MASLKAAGVEGSAVVVLEGGKNNPGLNETDANDWAFQQESYFHWAFGVQVRSLELGFGD